MEAQTELDRSLETATVAEYRRLSITLSEAKIGVRLAEAEADKHLRECEFISTATFMNKI